ncbi:MAG TPA: hypothetical protein VJN92_04660 [Candidatus Acidoferrum sp.]|nr:hypothetical protein [Candidatus Acidoferrum sp.]
MSFCFRLSRGSIGVQVQHRASNYFGPLVTDQVEGTPVGGSNPTVDANGKARNGDLGEKIPVEGLTRPLGAFSLTRLF